MSEATTFGAAWPVVGRDAELRAMTAAFDDAECGGIALIGAAGFGKTRLAARAVELAGHRGMATLSVRATRSGAAVPYAALLPLLFELGIPPEVESGLFSALADAIDQRRGDQRMALIVDDAQELDDTSASLLRQLVERGGAFVVVTVRTGDRHADAVVGMWKDQQVIRIQVGPLPQRDLRTLAELAVGGPMDGGTLQAVVEASGGNVLLLRELIQGAVESGALTAELGLWRLRGSLAHSPRLRDLIEQRFAGLSDVEREALELVALGDPVPLQLLEQLVTLQAVERLEERGLVDVLHGESGPELRLNHPLYGDLVRARLPSLRMMRLSRSLADAAEADGYVHGREALRVAVWRLDGGGGGQFDSTLRAARAALRSEDYVLAARLGRSAWEEWQSAEAALVLGDALDYLGHGREAERVLGEAAAMATTDRQLTSLAVRRASALFRSLGEVEQADLVMEQTAAQVTDVECRRELEALRGNNLLLAGDVARSIALDQKILLVPGDAAFAQASLDIGTGFTLAGRTTEAIAHTDAALSVRVNLDDEEQLSAVGIFLVAQALAQYYAGDLATAASISEAGYQVSVEKANADGQAWFASILGLVLLGQGRVASSANMFREAATYFGTLNHPGRRWGLGGVALASAHLGDHAAGKAAIRELDDMPETAVHLLDIGIMRGRAWTARARGELTVARDQLWEAVDLATRWGQAATAAEALHDLVRMGAGARAIEEMEGLSGRVDGAFMTARLAFARAVGSGDLDVAADAADQFETIGAQLFAAEAATLEGDLADAAGLRRRASFARARAERLHRDCEGAQLPQLGSAVGTTRLSAREQEVAMLAAQQLTSREIAERLFVSVRTVDNHLQRVYTKLGVTGRSELAEVLAG